MQRVSPALSATLGSAATDDSALDDGHVDHVRELVSCSPQRDDVRAALSAAVADNVIADLNIHAARPSSCMHCASTASRACRSGWGAPLASSDEHACCAAVAAAATAPTWSPEDGKADTQLAARCRPGRTRQHRAAARRPRELADRNVQRVYVLEALQPATAPPTWCGARPGGGAITGAA